MASSRLAVRLGVLALIVVVVWYISHLNAQIARLERRVTDQGSAPAAQSAPARSETRTQARPAGQSRTVTAEQREAMLEKLGGRGSSVTYPVWFATVPNNPEAAAFQRALQGVFEEAGWQVGGNVPVRFAMKAGVYVFAADEEPPEYVGMVHDALQAAGIPVASAGRGYREFARQKRLENPDWVGLELGPEQTYIIAIGRKPEEEPAS